MIKAAPVSPSKGKAKEETHWNAGWWDFQPLGDHVRRPVEWSNSGVIFTAHPTEPRLTGRCFSASKTFFLPSPPAVTSASYESPTLISVASTDQYLFAYFPGREGGGLGCIWKRGPQVDNWNLHQWWEHASGTGPVAATWLGTPREWVPTQNGLSRLPPRGPFVPLYEVTLLLVTEDHSARVHYLRNYGKSFEYMQCPLEYTGVVTEGQPAAMADSVGSSCVRRCSRAAIGLGYNETSIFIATRCRRLPIQNHPDSFDPMNLALPIDMAHFSNDSPSADWESLGEEVILELYELRLRFGGLKMNLQSLPLLPVHLPGTLSNLIFACTPHYPNESSRAGVVQKNVTEKGRLFLTVSTMEFDFTGVPSSELVIYSLSQQHQSSNNVGKSLWAAHRESALHMSPDVVSFILPRTNAVALLQVGLLHTSANQKDSTKQKEATIGVIKTFNIPELKEHLDWKSVPLLSKPERAGRDFPICAATSPNSTLVCTRLSSLWPTQTLVHRLPGPVNKTGVYSGKPPLSFALVSATLARRSSTDITHMFSSSSWSLEEVQDVLYHAFATLDGNSNGQFALLTGEMLGVVVETYRGRELNAQDREVKQLLREAWQAAHDMCSLVAYHYAFDECRDGDGYDDEALWPLVQLCSWVMSFIVKLMQQCILSASLDTDTPQQLKTELDLASASATQSMRPDIPILLHLSHPYALINLKKCVVHVKGLCEWLAARGSTEERMRIAQRSLSDLVDSSGIDLTALDALLHDCVNDAMTFSGEECRKGLSACRPTSAMHPHLVKVLRKLINSAVIDRATLFLKPAELVDGMSRMSIGAQRREREKDIITKDLLPDYSTHSTCLRCGGVTEEDLTGDRDRLTKWRAWERLWTVRCICGGSWDSGLP